MASKSDRDVSTPKEIEELLDTVDSTLDRLKTLYEQYFLGIQKQAPAYIHSDVERKLRDLTQLNVRNTGLRYRLATLQQKFGSYNSYWRRTLRQIENGTYVRNLAKIGREAIARGADIPEEILAAMPKRMREQVMRDRDQAMAIAKRRKQVDDGGDELLTLADEAPAAAGADDGDDEVAVIGETEHVRREVKTVSGAHVVSEKDADIDFNEFFSAFEDDGAKPAAVTQAITQPVPRVAPARPTASVPQPQPRSASGVTFRSQSQNLEAQAAAAPSPQTTAQKTPPPAPNPTTGVIHKTPPPAPNPTQTGVIHKTPPPAPNPTSTGVIHKTPPPLPNPTSQAIPRVPAPASSPTVHKTPPPPAPASPTSSQAIPRPMAPSQASRPNPIEPGAATRTGRIEVESMSGPFPRAPTPTPTPPPPVAAPTRPTPPSIPRPAPVVPRPAAVSVPKPAAPEALRPPPGMSEADVNALHAKYVKAKEMVGEKVDARSREKLLKTINQTAPKVMEQYKASGVDFTVVVKDNQVVIKAKPKT